MQGLEMDKYPTLVFASKAEIQVEMEMSECDYSQLSLTSTFKFCSCQKGPR